MAPSTPSTKDINDNIIAQLQASLNQTIPLLPKAFLRVFSKVFAAVYITIYKYAGFMFLQEFIQTATDDETEINGQIVKPLTFWGRLILNEDRTPAIQAELTIDIIVTNQVGNLNSGSQLIGETNGITYLTLTTIALDAPTKQVDVRAASDQAGGNGAGAIGNLADGSTISFANPLPNVARDASVNTTVTVGVDAETVDAYRLRIINRFQQRPQGGAFADYVTWGLPAIGIVNIFPYTSDCPGQVDVYCEANTVIDPDGIPTTGQLQAVKDLIELDVSGLATHRPVGALANTFVITRTPFDITVSGISNVDNLATVESDITAALTEFFLSRGPFIIGLNVPPRRDIITSSNVSGVVEDIVSAAGGVFIDAVTKQGVDLVETYALQIGEKAKALSVSFI